MSQKTKVTSLCAFLFFSLLLFCFYKAHLLLTSTISDSVVNVRFKDNNILSVEFHNRSPEAVFLPYFYFSDGKIFPPCIFQINANINPEIIPLLQQFPNSQKSAWKPIDDKVFIVVNTKSDIRIPDEIQLSEFPLGCCFEKIEPGHQCVLSADMSVVSCNQGSFSFSYTLRIRYLTQSDFDRPKPAEPPVIDDSKHSCPLRLFLDQIGIEHTPQSVFFEDKVRTVKVFDVLRIPSRTIANGKEHEKGGNE